MAKYIFTRELGLQPRINNINARTVTKVGGKVVLQLLKPNLATGQVTLITEKTFSVDKFLGAENIVFEKKLDTVFYSVPLDFNRFTFKVTGVPNYPFGKYKVNIYDRTAIRKIIDTYVSVDAEKLQELFYSHIVGQENAVQTGYRSHEFLELIFEFGNDIWNIIDQVKNVSALPPTYSEPTSTQGPGPVQTTNTSQNQTVTTVSQSQPTAQNKYILPLALLAALYVAKKKKLI